MIHFEDREASLFTFTIEWWTFDSFELLVYYPNGEWMAPASFQTYASARNTAIHNIVILEYRYDHDT